MYVPILKNRTVEMSVINELFTIPLSENTIPLIEVIQEKIQSNSKYSFFEIIEQITNRDECKNKFFVDISKRNASSYVVESVRTFLTTVIRDPGFYIDFITKNKRIEGLIPVVSYHKDWLESGLITKHAKMLREMYSELGFRISPNNFEQIHVELEEVLVKGDFVLLDIDNSSHTNPILRKIYNRLNAIKSAKGIYTIIINSTKDDGVTNVSLSNGEPIFEIDNSLRDLYKSTYNFDGFGDYAGVSSSLPTPGGGISPAGIYYSTKTNCFIGYRRSKSLSEFEDFIAPQIMASEYWVEYSEAHHNTCPGCKEINRIVEEKDPNEKRGKSQAKWKGITMSHYIYSIDEWLSSY